MNRRVFLSVLALLLMLGFVALGRWQLGREQEKRAQLASAAAALAAEPRPLAQVLESDLANGPAGHAIDRVAGEGVFVEGPRLLLDNQRRGERVGVRLYCVVHPDQGPDFLADLGWLPVGADRTLPAADCPQGRHFLAGLLVPPPSVGLRLGPGLVAQDDGVRWLAMRVEPADVSSAWQRSVPLAARVLRVDPALPIGFDRDLALLANTLPPEKHRGYAIQWFGLAVATFFITLVLNLRRRP